MDFVLVTNAWKNGPVHACDPSRPRTTLCGVLYSGWQKIEIPTSEFCSKCERSLKNKGYEVGVHKIKPSSTQ